MKLKNIFGALLATGIIAASASSVFAADGYTLGKPFDITTNETVSSLEVDHVIAVPVDVTSSTNSVTAYSVVVKYDSTVLSAGVAQTSLTSAEKTNIKALAAGSNSNLKSHNGLIGAIQGYVYDTGWEEDSIAGTLMVNVDYESDTDSTAKCVSAGWMTDGNAYATSSKPEFYLIFKVIGESSSDALNTPAVEVIAAESLVADTDNGKDATKDIPGETEVKSNSCAGAFKINIDSTKLAKYIHGMAVKIDGTSYALTDLVEDGDTYSFPVRLLTDQSGTKTVEVIATVADSDATDAATEEVSLGTINVELGSPSDYAATSMEVK